MNRQTLLTASVALTAVMLSACANLENIIYPPQVSLRNINVENINFRVQTFVLAFDVTNSNPFPLPISTISYDVELGGHRFFSGVAASEIMIPASSDGAFAISVDVNILRTAPELVFVLRKGTRGEIPYSIEGKLGIDVPYTKYFKFENTGLIRLQASSN